MDRTVWRIVTLTTVATDADSEDISALRMSADPKLEAVWPSMQASIDDFRFYDLRHTFASWYVMNGRDL